MARRFFNLPNNLFEEVSRKYPKRLAVLNRKLKQKENDLIILNKESDSTKNFITKLQTVICSDKSKLLAYGSAINLLRNKNSDLDLFLFPIISADSRNNFCADLFNNLDFRKQFMVEMLKLVESDAEIGGDKLERKNCELLYRIKYPLVILNFKDGRRVDIQIPSDADFNALRSSLLMRQYFLADNRFRIVYYWVRTLFEVIGIHNSKEGLFSSYHIACFVVHFLQNSTDILPKPVLPCLLQTHSHLFAPKVDIEKVIDLISMAGDEQEFQGWKSDNDLSVAELLVRFIDYYSKFDFRQHIYLEEKFMKQNNMRKIILPGISINLFDVYSKESVCRGRRTGRLLKKAMEFCSLKLLNGYLIDSFPDFHDASSIRTYLAQ